MIHHYKKSFVYLGLVLFFFCSINLLAYISPFSSNERSELEVDFTINQPSNCADQIVTFINRTPPSPQMTYLWDFGDGNTSTQRNATHTYNIIGAGIQEFNVTLTVTDADGNEGSKSWPIIVNQVSDLSIVADAGDASFDDLTYFVVCENTNSGFTFYNSSSTLATNEQYELDWGDGSEVFIGSEWSELNHVYATGIYTIKYSILSSNGCKTTNEFGVFVGGNPAVGLGNPGNTNVCTGTSLTFPITGTGNNPEGTRYIVTFSDDPLNPQIFEHPAPLTVTHEFKTGSCGNTADGFQNSFSVRIIAENPCSSSAATVVPIYVSETPSPEIEVPMGALCVDKPIVIGNASPEGSEVSTNGQCSEAKNIWQITPAVGWTLSNGVLGTINNPNSINTWVTGSQSISPIFSEPGTYTIKLISANRCGVEETEEIICILPTPEPEFELEQLDNCGPSIVKLKNISNVLGLCENEMFTWAISYNGGDCNETEEWSFVNETNPRSEEAELELVSPGNYTITLNAVSNCGIFRTSKTVTVSAPPKVEITAPSNICGLDSFLPTANISTCDQNEVTYKWTFEDGNPSTSTELNPGEITFLSFGEKDITLEVTGACGTTVVNHTISINSLPEISLGPDLEACFGETLNIGENVTFDENYTYQWSTVPFAVISNQGSHNPIADLFQTTTFTLQVTDKRTGCIGSDEFVITVTPAPVVRFDVGDQEICSGETTLPINIVSDPEGEEINWTLSPHGVEGVTQITGNGSIPAQTLVNKTGVVQELVYTATIESTNLGNCSFVPAQYRIKVNPEPDLEDESIEICSDQEFEFRPVGFQAGMTFTWISTADPGVIGNSDGSLSANSVNQTLRNETNNSLKVVYIITPSIGNCPGVPFELEVTVLPSPTVVFSEENQSICSGETSQEILISSDVANASFTWTANANGVDGVVSAGSGGIIPAQTLINNTSNPIIVEYLVFANTAGGGNCSGAPRIYAITVNPTLFLSSSISEYSGFGISCSGNSDGFITPFVIGGDGNYEYDWNGPNGFISNDLNIDNLIAGEYTLVVRDGSGCELIETFVLNEPDLLIVALDSSKDILCAGDSSGEIFMLVSGGVPEYSFQWFKDGVPFSIGQKDLVGVPTGEYFLIVTDLNGCSVESNKVFINEPETPLLIDIEKGDISCYDANDGFINLNISGGEPPYLIVWSNNSTQSIQQNLGPGTYSLQVSDQVGCVKTETVIIEDAPLFRINPEVRQISCFGQTDGYIRLNFEGGVGQPKVLWNNGEDRNELFNLSAGVYSVIITDETECEIRSEFNIIEPGLLLIESSVIDALDCDRPNSGAINVEVSGGVPPFSFQWSNGNTEKDLTNAVQGQYNLLVTDANGCETSESFAIKRPEPLKVSSIQRTNVECEPRLIEEEIQVSISGGVAPYTINWSGGEISQNGYMMHTREPGLYFVEVIDGNGCVKAESFDVVLSDIVLEIDIESVSFEQYQSHLVNQEIQFLNKSFGSILTFQWDFGDGNISFEENPIHTYQSEGEYEIVLSVTDIYGCNLEIRRKISVFDYFLKVPDAFTPNGDGTNDTYFPRFILIDSLEFWVLNKWGETVFHTKDKDNKGWDGMIDGVDAQAGNYVYKLEFKTLDGRKQQMTGVFLLIR